MELVKTHLKPVGEMGFLHNKTTYLLNECFFIKLTKYIKFKTLYAYSLVIFES